jgi:hypothetical protein
VALVAVPGYQMHTSRNSHYLLTSGRMVLTQSRSFCQCVVHEDQDDQSITQQPAQMIGLVRLAVTWWWEASCELMVAMRALLHSRERQGHCDSVSMILNQREHQRLPECVCAGLILLLFLLLRRSTCTATGVAHSGQPAATTALATC